MDFTYRIFQRIYKKGATPLLLLSIKLPHLTGEEQPCERINTFYRELEEELIKIAEEKLYPALLSQGGDGNGRKKGAYHLTLTAACKQEKEDAILCERRLTLATRGRIVKESVSREAVFSNGVLLPLREPPSKKMRKKPKKEKTRE